MIAIDLSRTIGKKIKTDKGESQRDTCMEGGTEINRPTDSQSTDGREVLQTELGLNQVNVLGLGDHYNRCFWAGSVSAKKTILRLGYQFFLVACTRLCVTMSVGRSVGLSVRNHFSFLGVYS